MILTRHSITSAVADIRAVDAQLGAIVRELQDAGVWSGADAERFLSRWNDSVHGRLRGAATVLDTVSLITLV